MLVISRLDHVVYPLPASLFETVIEQLTGAGFMAHSQRVHHRDGRVSAFFRVTGGYLEFCSNADASQCARGCSVWLCLTDLLAAVAHLPAAQRDRLTVTQKAPMNDDEPAWLLANLATRREGDVQLSMIEYLRGAGAETRVNMPDNGLFAINAVTVLSERPELERDHYRASLGELTDMTEVEENRFGIGYQWLAFRSRSGARDSGQIDLSRAPCLVHMATVDLNRTTSMLRAANFSVAPLPGLGVIAQSRLVPALCLVLETGMSPQWHHAHLLARHQVAHHLDAVMAEADREVS